MLLIHYYALATGATLLTAGWLFRPRDRTTVTSLGAFISWGLVALLGADVEQRALAPETVETVNNTSVAVGNGTTLVAAPVTTELRLFATLWALLSGLALILYIVGVYPPGDATGDDPIKADQ